MEDLTKILLTALGGLIVVITGQLIIKFIIDPIHDFKKLLGEIRFALIYHAQAIQTPGVKIESEELASKELRKMSCDLLSKSEAIPCYKLFSSKFPKFLPVKNKIIDAYKSLMGLSNSVQIKDRTKNHLIVEKIQRCLNFEIID